VASALSEVLLALAMLEHGQLAVRRCPLRRQEALEITTERRGRCVARE